MSGVVQAAQEIMGRYRLVLNHADISFDKRYELEQFLSSMQVADFYEIDRDVTLFLNDLKEELMNDCVRLTDIRVPVDSRPPSDVCFFYFTNSETGYLVHRYEAGALRDDYEPAKIHPFVLVTRASSDLLPSSFGGYIISDKEENNQLFMTRWVLEKANSELENYVGNANASIALLMSLINQPRFVVRDAAGSRQSRKHMHRKHGISTGAWHKIEWNLGEPVKAKSDSDKGGWRMPLHYTRGHWRKAQEHWDDVVIRKDNQPYKWIDGFWSGHPAYGVKKSYHAPKLGKKEVGQ